MTKSTGERILCLSDSLAGALFEFASSFFEAAVAFANASPENL